MARAWQRTLFTAVAAGLLGAECALVTLARAANEAAEEEPAQEAPEGQPDQPSKSGKKRQDPGEAQRSIEAALKQVQAGRPEQALPSLTATLAGGNLPPAIMARAFYVRGMAFRAQRRPAQAISDLNSALWLRGGLGGEDRDGAVKERAAAYADAGLNDQGEVAAGSAPKAASGNLLSGLFGSPGSFGGLFGGASGGSSPPPASPPVAAAPPPAPAPAPPATTAVVAGAWTSTTQAQPERRAVAAAAPAAKPEPPPRAAPPPARVAPAAARTEGRYQVQLGALRTEAEAQALVARAKREAALAGLAPVIDNAVIGNFGSFYRVRFGPFTSTQDAQGVCARLQGSGFDCMAVGP